MSKTVNIQYDEFIKSGKNSWAVKIDKQHCYFPYSLCELDERSKVISCPEWLAIRKELESYVDG